MRLLDTILTRCRQSKLLGLPPPNTPAFSAGGAAEFNHRDNESIIRKYRQLDIDFSNDNNF